MSDEPKCILAGCEAVRSEDLRSPMCLDHTAEAIAKEGHFTRRYVQIIFWTLIKLQRNWKVLS